MNKNFSVILNVVLAIAVAVLYYLHFSSPSAATAEVDGTDSTTAAKPIILDPKDIKASKIVYVNLDILNEKYEYLQDVSASAKAEQRSLESQYQTKAQKLQDDYVAYQTKAQQGLLSENQAKGEEEALMKRKEELDQLELKNQALMEKIQAKTDEMNENMKAYIKDYNKNTNYDYVFGYSNSPLSQILMVDDSLDITQEILDGLNAQYREKKGKK
ncbi:MAG: OmpH family outer membrane protein [Bacteroidetes bacterium]|nr:OmpH family outer membrane protein [Bacteroidota bacterium]